ncbi:hypothetical protein FBEOM_14329 [Fusarium beomiforme]|uniref:DDE Tnp4 domain-containing protein n=1 Tax=Fusarium beomiforme TaxID=44412 RepID=A0A9P5A4P2_9HYPO|nr:hypothetical protein FBEOM_14329 [Fusarium beomiforme]
MPHTNEVDEDELIEEIIIDDDLDNDTTNLEIVFSSMLGGIGVPRQARARALALAQDAEGAFIQRSCPPIARDYLASLLRAGDQSFIDLFRMPQGVFLDLCRWLRDNTEAASNTQTHLELRVMIFCWILAYGEKQRNTALKFGRSARLSEKVELDERYIHFSGANAAIDGTHIPAFVPIEQQARWWSYHHNISQNVLMEVDLDDEIFTYILAGAEGSMHDSAVMRFACALDLELKNNRLVLADAGFGARQGLLTPYVGPTYHLKEWQEAGNNPTSLKEAYNLRHAELRNVVERVIGQCKHRRDSS